VAAAYGRKPGARASGFLVEWDGFRTVLELGYATAEEDLLVPLG
jgi:hypothetical protein